MEVVIVAAPSEGARLVADAIAAVWRSQGTVWCTGL